MGPKLGMTSRRIADHNSRSSQGLSLTNCCKLWESTPNLSDMGAMDLR
jgi:hypothetical protein